MFVMCFRFDRVKAAVLCRCAWFSLRPVAAVIRLIWWNRGIETFAIVNRPGIDGFVCC